MPNSVTKRVAQVVLVPVSLVRSQGAICAMRALAAAASDAAISWCCCTSVSSTGAIALLLNGPIFSSGAERVGGRAGRAEQIAHGVVELIARQAAGRRQAGVQRAVAGHAGGDDRIDGAAAAADARDADVAGAARDAGDRDMPPA